MRALLFWGVCIPTRLALAQSGSPLTRLAASVISYRWLMGLEDSHTGFFGGPVWWADQRAAHGVLWGVYAMSGDTRVLYADTALGAANWFAQ